FAGQRVRLVAQGGHRRSQQNMAADTIDRRLGRRRRRVRRMAREAFQSTEQLLLLDTAFIEPALPSGGFAAEQVELVFERDECAFPLLRGAGEVDRLLTHAIELAGRN